MNDETFATVRRLVSDVCALDGDLVRPDGELLGYGLDSILVLDLLIECERQWGIELPEHDPALRNVVTVRDFVGLIEEKRRTA